MRVHRTEDPGAFLDATQDLLARDPVVSTVVSGVAQRALRADEAGHPRPDHPRWWAWVEDDAGDVIGVTMRTAPFEPHPLFVLPMPQEAAEALAERLAADGEHPGGVNGALPAARWLADAYLRRVGHGAAEVAMHTRLFECREVVEPRPAAGRLRAATEADLDLALAWFKAFDHEADVQAGRDPRAGGGEHWERADVERRLDEGGLWLWETPDGEVVHLTGHGLPAYGVVRVGPVYTPGARRGHGYASATVAAVTARLLAEGHRVCLFTDQANPTSNAIYQALGYRAVVDMANLRVVTSERRRGFDPPPPRS